MAVFAYQALRPDGERVSGQLEAQSRAEAYRKLDLQNLQPVTMEAGEGSSSKTSVDNAQLGGPVHLTRAQVISFTEELSDMLDAGLQLESALRIMEGRTELSGIKEATIALRQKVRDGVNFSVALRSVSPSFGDLYCNLVAAGELSGALPQLLRRQSSYLVAVEELQSKVKSALIYPAFIFGAGMILMVVFMTWLLPQLVVLISKTDGTLPLPTRILIGISDFFGHYWWAVIGGAALVIFTFVKFISTEGGKLWWDRVKLKLPLFGPVMMARLYTQFCHTMANLLGNGVSMLNALRLTHKAAGNTHFQAVLYRAIDSVAEGGALTQALRRVKELPALMIDILAVGEQTGDIAGAFAKAGNRYEKELNKKITRLTELIQPVVIIAMALLVGLVAYSIIAGIFQSVNGLNMKSPKLYK